MKGRSILGIMAMAAMFEALNPHMRSNDNNLTPDNIDGTPKKVIPKGCK